MIFCHQSNLYFEKTLESWRESCSRKSRLHCKNNTLKETYGAQENGDIIIDRRSSAVPQVVEKIVSAVEQKANGISASVAEVKVGA